MLQGNDLEVACGCDEDVDVANSLLQSGHLEAFHACLQCANGVALCDVDTSPAAAQGKSAALANVTIAAHHGALASDHDISGPHDGVWERVAAAINVVELGLCYAIVHIDGREKELTLRSHFLQTVDSGGGFLADSLALLCHPAVLGLVSRDGILQELQDALELSVVGAGRIWQAAILGKLLLERGGACSAV